MLHKHGLVRLAALTVLLISVLVVSVPTFAAVDATIVGYQLNEADCYVDVIVQVEDASFYAVNMWDDGNFRAGAGASADANVTMVVRFSIGGLILQGASGIGVYVEDAVGAAATEIYAADGSAQLWSDTVGQDCIDAGTMWGATVVSVGSNEAACIYPLPVGSVVYNVPAGALAFYAADPNTYTGFNLPPGTWYVSEFGEAYAKIWIACSAQPVYIPIENVLR